MQQWFNQLARKDQIMLLVGGVCITFYLLFVLIMPPLNQSADQLTLQNTVAAETLVNVKSLASEYKVLEKTNKPAASQSQNITRLIDSTVKSNELVMSRFQPSSSGDVQVRFENAAFSNLLGWLNELENTHGIVIKDLSVSPGSAAGLVNVSVRLHQGA